MMWYDGGWGMGGWFIMTVFMVLFWAVLIVGLVALVRYLAGTGRHQRASLPPPAGEVGWQGRGAENLLAERFARGEIDEEEYQRRLALLREHR
ncbi:SHOCT domain-containing protein [Streptomyces griseoluteus]|uniref:SHOCT domain-containing protein n=1 Tax=Streptomyces griseoluteus TaxID=29306 RepID=UPI0036BB6DA4